MYKRQALSEAFRYRAGQFCTFRVRLDGGEHLRSYSMSSSPETDTEMTVTVKRVPGGLVSNWFNDHVAVGDLVEATRPAGVFCVRETGRSVVAFCGGSGVTPVISIAKSALAATDRSVRILYANRDRDSVIFDDALKDLVGRHADRLELHHHFDADGGYLDAEAIAAFTASTLDADFYICGPTPFMDLVEATLLGMGVTEDRILIERFGTPVGPTELPASEDATGPEAEAEAQAEGTTTVTLILSGRTTEVAYRTGDTVLETARRGGLQPPYSCEAGNCATCMGIVREGAATMRANNALTPEELEEGWVLTCQAVPTTPTITVEYESF